MTNEQNSISSLKLLFNQHNIDGYIIPSTDEYISEYTAPYARRLEYVSGFTGSNGIAVIMRDVNLFFTDGRYTTQAARQLDSSFKIYDISQISYITMQGLIGYDPMLFTEVQLLPFKHCNLINIEKNLVDEIWADQPHHPKTKVWNYDIKYSGEDTEGKIQRVREKIYALGAQYCLLTSADSICWLLNIRASDIDFCPLMLGYCVVGLENIRLFSWHGSDINLAKLADNLVLHNTSEIVPFLNLIQDYCIVDKKSCPVGLASKISKPIFAKDPCQLMKACKHPNEIEFARKVHIRDAIALCETFAWAMNNISNNKITEYDIGTKLTEFRSQQKDYVMDSFPAIVGYQENGAIIHYKAEIDTAKTIINEGLLLIDSGGHYLGGTTDVTRVLAIGKPTNEQRKRYTQVLKGHIALASQMFPKNTKGSSLDVLARMHLWQEELDYMHGTGHGVGNCLSVHEGPQRISSQASEAEGLQEGMIISNEPGFYKVGEYGIRIENLVFVEAHGKFLSFQNLTLVPYCKDLIDETMLSKTEIVYLKNYHELIIKEVFPHLSDDAKQWLINHSF